MQDVIDLSRTESPTAKRAIVEGKNAYWSYKIHRADLSPKLTMNSVLPSFSSSVRPITQSNGSIVLHEVSENTAGVSLQIDQPLPFLGAQVFVKSGLNRYDNLQNHTFSYGGSPIEAGINLPIFRYNKLKWDRRIAPVEFQESKLRLSEDIELSTLKAIQLLFELASSQQEHSIALKNCELNSKLFEIAKEKFKLGKISKSELIQVQLMFINAENRLQSARQYIDNAELELKSHLGITIDGGIGVSNIPELELINIDKNHAVEMVRTNNSKSLGFVRRMLESNRNIAMAKGSTGVSGNLYAAFGYAIQFENFNNIPANQPKHQVVEFGISIPIIDWGRTKAVRTKAEINLELTTAEINQEKIDLDREVIVLVNTLNLLQNQRAKILQADSLSAERYKISHNRYLVGDISVVELNIAQQEKDRAMQQTLFLQRDIWLLYYKLRRLTLYDYINNVLI